jgi:hypothetical protein
VWMQLGKRRSCSFGLILILLVMPAAAQAPIGAGYTYTDATSYGVAGTNDQSDPDRFWLPPGRSEVLLGSTNFIDHDGAVGLVNRSGAIQTFGHPFFDVIGTNGRGCVSCHQPSQAMSLAAANLRNRWDDSEGHDPVFAAIDGSDCPVLPQSDKNSHGLLLSRGLFRIALAWPPKDASGKPILPDFTIDVARDPNGCNNRNVYGPTGQVPTISVYRRPRMAANFSRAPDQGGCTGDSKMSAIMADGRATTLKAQAIDAFLTHLQLSAAPSERLLNAIVDFECQVYTAQASDLRGWPLTQKGSPPGLGPQSLALAAGLPAYLKRAGDGVPVFQSFDNSWKSPTDLGEQNFRRSVVHGAKLFVSRHFEISGAKGLNNTASPISGTCASCHDIFMSGIASAHWIDTGSTNLPWAIPAPDLPLFKITCNSDASPHPFLGRVIYTQDPGRAMTTGKCADVGAISVQQLRGLSARAPYFSNGSARTLGDVVDFYDRRFKAGFSAREKQDLVNFLSVL